MLVYFKYPAALGAALAEAAWLLYSLPGPRIEIVPVATAILWVAGAWQVVAMWLGRIRKVPAMLRLRGGTLVLPGN